MLDWKELFVIPPELETGQSPSRAKQAETDGGRLVALVYGRGSPVAKFVMVLAHQTAPGPSTDDPVPAGRYPTIEEIEAAVDAILPRGVFMLIAPPVQAIAPGDRPEILGWGAVSMIQAFPGGLFPHAGPEELKS
jgi:hypothetical protein